jgi:hypothetical protein
MRTLGDSVDPRWRVVPAGKRRLVVAALLLVAGGGVPSVTGTVAQGAVCQYTSSLGHGWSVLAPPPFTAGPTSTNRYQYYPFFMGNGAIYAAVPGSGQTLLATNGTQIMKTTNGGCTWQATYTFAQGDLGQDPSALAGSGVDTNPVTGAYEIQGFATSRYPGSAHTAYAVLAVANSLPAALATENTVSPPVVILQSTNDGSSWQQVNPSPSAAAPAVPRCYAPGDPAYGPLRLVAAPSNPNTVYLLCGTNGHTIDYAATLATGPSDLSLYESADGGVSWVQRTVPTYQANGVPLQALAVDPGNDGRVWLATNLSSVPGSTANLQIPTLWFSSDSGQHWTAKATGGTVFVRGDPKNPQSVSLTGEFGVDLSKTSHVALARGANGVLRTTDRGVHWQTVATTSASGVVAAHSIYVPNGDLYVVRDFGVPPGYAGPTYCTNTSCSWEQMFRIRGSKTTAIPSPGRAISDFYGLQSAGGSNAAIYGYALMKTTPSGLDHFGSASNRAVFLSWTGG